ncbi:MAG: hypothetical protein J6A76_08395 [Oscillospiraceae bacterium]|nr:hypothetical protein [Oscillospiraceae bacterium]
MKNKGTVWIIIIVLFVAAASVMVPSLKTQPQGIEQLYAVAMSDSVFAEADEIYPLVTITENGKVTWDENKERVLLLSWHNAPQFYPDGEDVCFDDYEMWTFTDKEIKEWYKTEGKKAKDMELRFEQLIGLPKEKEYTHFSALWVNPEDVIRPAYITDITAQMEIAPDKVKQDEQYSEWFDQNILWSYFDSSYPWTRLGYTYDWSGESDEYGLTEFLVKPGAEMTVEFTKTTEEFIHWLAE